MSHVVTSTIEITDLEAVREAARELGFTIHERKTYKWFGRWVGDSPLPEGLTVNDLGKCEFAVSVPGATYEYGVVKLPNGKYTIAYDYWSTYGARLRELEPKFKQYIAVHTAERVARQQRKHVRRVMKSDGTIRLVVLER